MNRTRDPFKRLNQRIGVLQAAAPHAVTRNVGCLQMHRQRCDRVWLAQHQRSQIVAMRGVLVYRVGQLTPRQQIDRPAKAFAHRRGAHQHQPRHVRWVLRCQKSRHHGTKRKCNDVTGLEVQQLTQASGQRRGDSVGIDAALRGCRVTKARQVGH